MKRISVRDLAGMAISVSFIDTSLVWYCVCEVISLDSSKGSVSVEAVVRVLRHRMEIEKHDAQIANSLGRFVEYIEKSYAQGGS